MKLENTYSLSQKDEVRLGMGQTGRSGGMGDWALGRRPAQGRKALGIGKNACAGHWAYLTFLRTAISMSEASETDLSLAVMIAIHIL
ncbi:MAG: hypothetical protein EAZ28_25050 [Oscillatoriales cyanobacterium]|nr:MAG: hypothetical protein EAZ28_25050 [Oscillatoriales cyanobacterium]